jgi:hypothetical protein
MAALRSWFLLGVLALTLFPSPGGPDIPWLNQDFGEGRLEISESDRAGSSGPDPLSALPPELPLSTALFIPFLEPLLSLCPAPPVRGRRARQSARLGGQRPPPEPRPKVES